MISKARHKVLIKSEDIQKRVTKLANKITSDYKDKELLVIGILKGSIPFFADLVRAIDKDIEFGFIGLTSYGKGTKSTGNVSINMDLVTSVEGKHVLIVEDIIDSGNTFVYLKNLLISRGVASVALCSLLDKPLRREVDIIINYVGFEIPDEFVIGYGLDYAEKYRNLRDVCILDPSEYE